MPVAEYLGQSLWSSMGAEEPGSWSLDENGFEKMESGINGTARDFAKFGYLFLNGGKRGDNPVLPTSWVEESTTANLDVQYERYYDELYRRPGFRLHYKYFWWIIETAQGSNEFAALGNHGQFIYVAPEKNLVLVRFGEKYGELKNPLGWVELIRGFLEEWS